MYVVVDWQRNPHTNVLGIGAQCQWFGLFDVFACNNTLISAPWLYFANDRKWQGWVAMSSLCGALLKRRGQ